MVLRAIKIGFQHTAAIVHTVSRTKTTGFAADGALRHHLGRIRLVSGDLNEAQRWVVRGRVEMETRLRLSGGNPLLSAHDKTVQFIACVSTGTATQSTVSISRSPLLITMCTPFDLYLAERLPSAVCGQPLIKAVAFQHEALTSCCSAPTWATNESFKELHELLAE
jgi:hypothetical protein